MIEDCMAIVMAGGQSQRMGSDKAALLIGDKTLLQRVTGIMQQVFPQVLVSVRQPRPKISLPQVCDAYPGAGPLAGLCAGPVSYTHLDVYKRQSLMHGNILPTAISRYATRHRPSRDGRSRCRTFGDDFV